MDFAMDYSIIVDVDYLLKQYYSDRSDNLKLRAQIRDARTNTRCEAKPGYCVSLASWER